MKITTELLKKVLVEPGHINADAFESIARDATNRKKDLAELIVHKDLIKDEQLGQLLAEELGYKFVNLGKTVLEDGALDVIPESMARAKKVIVFGVSGEKVKIAMRDMDDFATKHMIEKKVGKKADAYYITGKDFFNTISRYKANIKAAYARMLEKFENNELEGSERDQAIVDLVDGILLYGYQNKASDIHIEPYQEKVLLRFRIDGIMNDMLDMPKAISDLILTRIKIMARLRTDEHRAALDGKLKFQSQGERVDVRVSIVPVTEGENVVMRLLSSKSRQFSLTDVGMGEEDLKKVRTAIKNPHGMIVVTGPTGSGKTTTVYAVMKILNTRDVHISTIEDPVEYNIEGISQIQVQQKSNLTFAKGLKAIVRQDPDIIMVGEVRDEETASISVNAAMTGHLVLTTLHANDAATTLPRFLDMNVEPFLAASTVNVAIAQRLVRKICPKCRMTSRVDEDLKRIVDANSAVKKALEKRGVTDLDKMYVFKGKGCSVCHNSGFLGRIGVFEVLVMSEEVKKAVMERKNSDEIAKVARATGMKTMLEDGIAKVMEGLTTLEEVVRVTKE